MFFRLGIGHPIGSIDEVFDKIPSTFIENNRLFFILIHMTLQYSYINCCLHKHDCGIINSTVDRMNPQSSHVNSFNFSIRSIRNDKILTNILSFVNEYS